MVDAEAQQTRDRAREQGQEPAAAVAVLEMLLAWMSAVKWRFEQRGHQFGGCVQEKWTQQRVKSDWGQMAQSDIFIEVNRVIYTRGAH